jgi:diguanylate cyclase (GGDEF)-like protein
MLGIEFEIVLGFLLLFMAAALLFYVFKRKRTVPQVLRNNVGDDHAMHHMAYHDPLTSLANRNKLEEFINLQLAVSKRHGSNFALILIDLDCFKNINDTIGHDAGDLLLQIIANRLQHSVRSTDLVARLGGDEFVLVITDLVKTDILGQMAKKILEAIVEVMVIQGKEIVMTASLGITLYPEDGHEIHTLLKNADLALYRAKNQGRNHYQFYTREMTMHAERKLSLHQALKSALANNKFLLHYQPKLNVLKQNITGIEAFLRWENNKYKAVSVEEIISLAEETGLIIQFSEWVINTACTQLKIWQDLGLPLLCISVNCSYKQFKQAALIENILLMISHSGISPHFFEIEITEKMIMQDPENMLTLLHCLKDKGIKITIDNFGTGYWSINNLRQLTVDQIKIDKTFIKHLEKDEQSRSIVSAMIAMINRLGIVTIAEGVETKEQYDFLVKEGCNEIQGYYFTKPLSQQAMTEFLLQHALNQSEKERNLKIIVD